jgi:hypothetical protein
MDARALAIHLKRVVWSFWGFGFMPKFLITGLPGLPAGRSRLTE